MFKLKRLMHKILPIKDIYIPKVRKKYVYYFDHSP